MVFPECGVRKVGTLFLSLRLLCFLPVFPAGGLCLVQTALAFILGVGFLQGFVLPGVFGKKLGILPEQPRHPAPNTFLSRACHDRYSGKSYTGAECAQPVFAGKRRSQSNYRYANRRILSNHRTPRSVHPGRRMLAACKIGPGIRTECWGQSPAAAPQGHTARYRRLIG